MLNTTAHNFNRTILSCIRVTLNMLNTIPHNFNRPILTCIRVTLNMLNKSLIFSNLIAFNQFWKGNDLDEQTTQYIDCPET